MCEAVLQSEEEAEGMMQLGRTVLNELSHHPKELSEMRLCVWGNGLVTVKASNLRVFGKHHLHDAWGHSSGTVEWIIS